MSGWADEVDTGVDARVVVRREGPLDLQFLLQVVLKLRVDVVDDRLEAVLLVDLVSVADGIAQSKLSRNG